MHTNRFKYDSIITAAMVEDLLFDPVMAAKVLLDVEMPPHQELRLLQMWTNHFTIDDSGFSTGKTFTAAVCIAIRSMLIPGRISGILSGTFRQGKLVFKYFDKWYQSSKIFRSTIKMNMGKPKIIHSNDAWEIHWRGGSNARVLPPNFMADSTRLRSERWNDAYFDEWTVYGNFTALTSTLFGRATSENKYDHCPVRMNHIHCFSTPGYEHDPPFTVVKNIQERIDKGSKSYVRFTSNYRHVPRTRKWRSLISLSTIRLMQDTNTNGAIGSEIDGLWQKDSKSFYSSLSIHECQQETETILSRGNNRDSFVGAFDVARGGNQKARETGRGDDFSFCVLRIPENGIPYPCHVVRYNDITSEQMSAIVHKLNIDFNFSCIVYDPGGGGLFVLDDLKKPIQTIRGNEVSVVPLIEVGDTSGVIGNNILTPIKRASTWIKAIWGSMSSESVLINRMHSLVKASIERKSITLPAYYDKLDVEIDIRNMYSLRDWLNKTPGLSEYRRSLLEQHLMVMQLCSVDIARDKGTGMPVIDSFGMFKFESKERKDSAYSFCYSLVAYEIYKHMREKNFVSRSSSSTGFYASIESL